jgi:polyhydroxyalkanoate synthesis regulator phasin
VLGDVFVGQVRVLQDLLQFEKEKNEELDGKFKAEKKVLAKGIKSLRSEVLARQAERDNYKQQLDELRRSVSQLRK